MTARKPVVLQGIVYEIGYQECDLDQTGERSTAPICFALARLIGQSVRVTIEVLPNSQIAPMEGAANALTDRPQPDAQHPRR